MTHLQRQSWNRSEIYSGSGLNWPGILKRRRGILFTVMFDGQSHDYCLYRGTGGIYIFSIVLTSDLVLQILYTAFLSFCYYIKKNINSKINEIP